MSLQTPPSDSDAALGPLPRSLTGSPGLRRRLLADAIARWVVTAGGAATMLSIAAILLFIGMEVIPLWQAARMDVAAQFQLASTLRLPMLDEQRGVLAGLAANGVIDVVRLDDGKPLASVPIEGLDGQAVAAAARAGHDNLMLSTASGELFAVRLVFEGGRMRRPGEGADAPASKLPAVALKSAGRWNLGEAPRLLASSVPGDDGVLVVYATTSGSLQLYASVEKKNLFGAVQKREVRHPLPVEGEVTALAVDRKGTRVYVGTAAGVLQLWDLKDPENPRLIGAAMAAQDRAITALAFLIGDTSMVVGDAGGGVNVWFPVRDAAQPSGWRLQLVHPFPPHASAVTAVAASPRDRSFLTADATGQVVLRHATTDRDLATAPQVGGPVAALAYAPKANGAAAITATAAVSQLDISNPHPEVSFASLFGKVWYDGYEAPAYVWQSTGGTDDFEPKLSLRPLIFGTIKGTFYALLFAVPLAVLAALYTSQFAHPTVRNIVKPVVEVMAALPSVVLGFLAGLWLAPTIEGHVPAIFAMMVLTPTSIVATAFLWTSLPRSVRSRVYGGLEAVLLVPIVVGVVAFCWSINPWLEHVFFGGSFQNWLLDSAGLRFDQRNCLVVGFAMGFAVIPIIFTISEDALANVPRRLVSASLALGATAWQTAVRVVLPTASPGIFSAVMVGFGRAVGETMIVLMATGNTPISDWNIFTGMRTLSANIAVEISEAPHGGTLYRVLFLAALLLFITTFLINTIADLVRQRLRQRYQEL